MVLPAGAEALDPLHKRGIELLFEGAAVPYIRHIFQYRLTPEIFVTPSWVDEEDVGGGF
jgi:hypothetical protein